MTFNPDLVQALESYGTVLHTRLGERAVRAFCRDDDVELLQRHLDHARHNSLMVVGPSGSGKTTVLHELFLRVTARDEQPWLILETSTSQLMAGTAYIGEWQTRVQELLNLAERSASVAIYFTDIHHLGDAGKHSKSDENMAAFLQPFVENGTVTLIGECTPETFRSGIERLPSFGKLFTVFRIEESDEQEAREIVEQTTAALTSRIAADGGPQLTLPEHTLTAVLEFGRLYFPGLAAPGGAVKLLGQLISQAASHGGGDAQERELSSSDVVRTLESFTGIPSLLLDDSQPLDLSDVRDFFESRVIGQNAAVEAVIDLITLIKAGLTDTEKPMGVLFFIGPTGVGKTELAKALAEFIFGSDDRLIRFDMSEFKDFHSFEKLIGDQNAKESSPSQAGNLLTQVRQQPFSVILLDEIEKAHPNVFDVLLQMFDDGRLSDPLGNTTNFTQTIVVLTSNLGSQLTDAPPLGFHAAPDNTLQLETTKAMEEFFRPEFLNRIDRICMFKPLQREHVRILAQRELGNVLLRSGITRRGLRVDVDPGVIDILVREGFSPLYGARPLKRAVEKFALMPVARQIVNMGGENQQALLRLLPQGNGITVRIVQDRLTRKQESLARGVKVVDPVQGKSEKLKPPEIEDRISQLNDAVQSLEGQCEERKLEQQKTDLLHRTTQVNFWDKPDAARDVLGEIYRIERLLEAVSKVRKRTDDLGKQFTSAQASADAERLATVAARTADVHRHADLVRYSLECTDTLDRCDTFLVLTTVDEAAPDDIVGLLTDMYSNWAQLKGFEAKLIHEELDGPKKTKAITVLIEGVAAYGILRGEEGMHEFIVGRTAKTRKQSYFAKVRVLPLNERGDSRAPDTEISIDKKKARGAGERCKRYKSTTTATHTPSLVTVTATGPLVPDEAAPIVSDWLQAELHHTRQLTQHSGDWDYSGNPVPAQVETVIRKYTLRPQSSVKDPRTGVAVSNIGEVWKGGVDEFLYAALLLRR